LRTDPVRSPQHDLEGDDIFDSGAMLPSGLLPRSVAVECCFVRHGS
jgi:hypothetical protein